jgi:hypothetical protein
VVPRSLDGRRTIAGTILRAQDGASDVSLPSLCHRMAGARRLASPCEPGTAVVRLIPASSVTRTSAARLHLASGPCRASDARLPGATAVRRREARPVGSPTPPDASMGQAGGCADCGSAGVGA